MSKKSPYTKLEKIVMVSGGFDPIHPGHVRLFKEAKKLGDRLVVVINNDNWIRNKKGQGFMNAKDRAEVISHFRDVDRVIISVHRKNSKDARAMSVCAELSKIRPYMFVNGGDRNNKDADNPLSSLHHDINMCKKLGIKIVYNVGKGGKINSSSKLLKKYVDKKLKSNASK